MTKKKSVAVATKQRESILAYLQEGETLINISKKDNTPSLSTMHKWCRDDDDFSRQVETARVAGAIFYVEKLIELTESDVKPQDVMWIREKISTYKWLATKLLPQFSDRQHIESYNKHEVVNISWVGSIAKCPECGWKEAQAD
jgi:hypothetical protein|tara:strand:+ start:3658 stop:4086 length:429 start_codon:yes stop_codon:yes gene_type:complete